MPGPDFAGGDSLMWPFSCRACKAKDAEIAFLRGFVGSVRSVVREPEPRLPENAPEGSEVWANRGLAELAKREAVNYPTETPGYFFRDPVQDFDPTKDER